MVKVVNVFALELFHTYYTYIHGSHTIAACTAAPGSAASQPQVSHDLLLPDLPSPCASGSALSLATVICTTAALGDVGCETE